MTIEARRDHRAIAWTAAKTILFTLVVPGAVVLYIPYRLAGSPSRLPDFGARWLLAIPLALFALAVFARCAWDFVTSGRGTPAPYDPPKRLVVRGLYRYVRNPMYVAAISLLLGEAVLFRSRALFLYTLAAFAFYSLLIIGYEEPKLRRTFGEEYERYCRRVPRWLPWPRPSE